MVAEIHRLQTKPIAINWQCSACGIDAGCNCGAPLMSKAQRAAEALAASPQMSNRAIAEETGLSEPTIRRARTASSDAVDKEPRIGLDGKQRRMPIRAPIEDDEDDIDTATPSDKRKAFLIFSNEAMLLAKYDGPIKDDVIIAARATAAAWNELVSTMEKAK